MIYGREFTQPPFLHLLLRLSPPPSVRTSFMDYSSGIYTFNFLAKMHILWWDEKKIQEWAKKGWLQRVELQMVKMTKHGWAEEVLDYTEGFFYSRKEVQKKEYKLESTLSLKEGDKVYVRWFSYEETDGDQDVQNARDGTIRLSKIHNYSNTG